MKSYLLLLLGVLPACADLQIVSGQGQMVFEQFRGVPLVVRALDASGRPLANVAVSWSMSPSLGGTLSSSSTVTDQNGYSSVNFTATSIQPGTSWAQITVTASSSAGATSFTLTTIQGRTSGGASPQPSVEFYSAGVLRGNPGATLPEAFVVRVTATAGTELGRGIPNVGIRIVYGEGADPATQPGGTCTSAVNGVILTDAQGFARCDLVLNRNSGTGGFQLNVGDMVITRGVTLEIASVAGCSVTLTLPGQSVPASGGNGNIVADSNGCTWIATTTANWITITSGASGSGPGIVSYTVAPNSGAARTGTIAVGDKTFTVTQSGTGTTGGGLAFLVPPGIPSATVGTGYSYVLGVAGGTPPYTWTATQVPPGLSFNPANGMFTGVPSTAGTYSIPVAVQDAAGVTAAQTFTLVISGSGSTGGGTGISFTTTSFPAGSTNVSYSQALSVTGGCQNPFSPAPAFSIVSGDLPPGLTLQSGVISGTPTSGGTFAFSVRATDYCNNSATGQFSITIAGPVVGPTLTASPQSLSFTMQRGADAPAAQSVDIAAGSSAVQFNAVTASSAGWLSAAPTSGATPARLTVGVVNASTLPPGTYTGTISIVAQGQGSPVTVPVSLVVTAPVAPIVDPIALTFDYQVGAATPAAQNISVLSFGGALNFTATTAGGQWLAVAPASGSAPGQIAVTANPTGLTAGTYTGSVSITPDTTRVPVIVAVTLRVTQPGPQVGSVTNGGSFVSGPIAPGEIVTIFGTNLGPRTLATLRLTPAGTIDTALSTARVWFDDQPAAVLHVVSTQITVIAPYSIAGKSEVRIQTEFNGVRSPALRVPVAAAAPGLFTIAGTQGAILNQDNSVNGPQNQAAPGSYISVYATGEGEMSPLPIEGGIATADALSRPTAPVRVTIGGRDAELSYAGSAPGNPVGLLQVNVRIPEDTPSGPIPVVLMIGGVASQSGVVVQVANASR